MNSVNKAYRLNDVRRWRGLEFVIGYEIKPSNNPKYECETCKILSGKYPKYFNWHGWHDECHCHVIPIMEDFYSEDRSNHRVNRLRAALNGVDPEKYGSKHEIKYAPLEFLNWIIQKNYLSSQCKDPIPYFVTENRDIIVRSYEYYKNKYK